MQRLFLQCVWFNQPLNKWNVSNIINMSYMFSNCKKFNQNTFNISYLQLWNYYISNTKLINKGKSDISIIHE